MIALFSWSFHMDRKSLLETTQLNQPMMAQQKTNLEKKSVGWNHDRLINKTQYDSQSPKHHIKTGNIKSWRNRADNFMLRNCNSSLSAINQCFNKAILVLRNRLIRQTVRLKCRTQCIALRTDSFQSDDTGKGLWTHQHRMFTEEVTVLTLCNLCYQRQHLGDNKT